MLRSHTRSRPEPASTATSVAFDDEVVVYCERTEQMHCLDQSASLVWAFCDGSRDIDQIAAEVATLVGLTAQIVRPDVQAAVQQFRALGILR